MITVGFDQSTTKTGYAVFDDMKLIDYGLINLEGDHNTPRRIKNMFFAIKDIIDKYQATFVVAEADFFKNNKKTMLMLSQLQGMIIGYAYANMLDVSSPLPCEWRKPLGFKQGKNEDRASEKQQAIDFIKHTFGVEASEDECEAIALTYAMML